MHFAKGKKNLYILIAIIFDTDYYMDHKGNSKKSIKQSSCYV